MDNQEIKLKVFMLPWVAHGHISPFFELAKKLTKRNVFIYFCSTPICLTSIKKKLDTQNNYSPSIELVELELPSLPQLPPEYHTTNGLPHHLMPTLHEAFLQSQPAIRTLITSLSPDLVMFDVSQSWISSLVSSLNIPGVPFSIFNVTTPYFFGHMTLSPGVEFPYPAIFLRDYEKPAIQKILEHTPSDETTKYSDNFSLMLFKSFEEVEGKYLKGYSIFMKKRVVPVGHLVEEVLEDKEEDKEVIEWLDMKQECSSVFVSFGSEYFLTSEDLRELAHGLELSGVNFVWVIRFPKGEECVVEEVLPKGFKERVGERGLVIVNWAPQIRLLGHKSIGGFVSHCGWSSLMESMSFGVPLVGMPMQLDQPVNARLMTEIGVGIEVVRDNEGKLHREEVAKVVRQVVVEESGEDARRKAKELCKIMRDKGDGEMDVVMEELLQVCGKTK